MLTLLRVRRAARLRRRPELDGASRPLRRAGSWQPSFFWATPRSCCICATAGWCIRSACQRTSKLRNPCKGGIINTRYARQLSRLRQDLCEVIGFSLVVEGCRQFAVVPRTKVTETQAERWRRVPRRPALKSRSSMRVAMSLMSDRNRRRPASIVMPLGQPSGVFKVLNLLTKLHVVDFIRSQPIYFDRKLVYSMIL